MVVERNISGNRIEGNRCIFELAAMSGDSLPKRIKQRT